MSGTTASCIRGAHKKERSHPLSLRHIPIPLQGDVLMLARQTDIAIRKSAHLLVSQGTKKGAVSLSLPWKLKVPLGGTSPSDHHHHR